MTKGHVAQLNRYVNSTLLIETGMSHTNIDDTTKDLSVFKNNQTLCLFSHFQSETPRFISILTY